MVALLAASFLDGHPFPASYGLTYLVAFAFTALGLVCIAAMTGLSVAPGHDLRTLVYFSVANPKITQACELMHEVLCDQIDAQQKITTES